MSIVGSLSMLFVKLLEYLSPRDVESLALTNKSAMQCLEDYYSREWAITAENIVVDILRMSKISAISGRRLSLSITSPTSRMLTHHSSYGRVGHPYVMQGLEYDTHCLVHFVKYGIYSVSSYILQVETSGRTFRIHNTHPVTANAPLKDTSSDIARRQLISPSIYDFTVTAVNSEVLQCPVVMLVGGYDPQMKLRHGVTMFVPSSHAIDTDDWTTVEDKTNQVIARFGHGALAIGDTVFICGGAQVNGPGSASFEPSKTAEQVTLILRDEGIQYTKKVLPDMNVPRYKASMILVCDKYPCIVGGNDGPMSIEVFDGNTWHLTVVLQHALPTSSYSVFTLPLSLEQRQRQQVASVQCALFVDALCVCEGMWYDDMPTTKKCAYTGPQASGSMYRERRRSSSSSSGNITDDDDDSLATPRSGISSGSRCENQSHVRCQDKGIPRSISRFAQRITDDDRNLSSLSLSSLTSSNTGTDHAHHFCNATTPRTSLSACSDYDAGTDCEQSKSAAATEFNDVEDDQYSPAPSSYLHRVTEAHTECMEAKGLQMLLIDIPLLFDNNDNERFSEGSHGHEAGPPTLGSSYTRVPCACLSKALAEAKSHDVMLVLDLAEVCSL